MIVPEYIPGFFMNSGRDPFETKPSEHDGLCDYFMKPDGLCEPIIIADPGIGFNRDIVGS